MCTMCTTCTPPPHDRPPPSRFRFPKPSPSLSSRRMPEDPPSHIYYKRSRFSSKLPAGRRYTPTHYWLDEVEPGLWRIGFTKFATRMLGDFVEHAFEPKVGDPVTVGQTIGWVEGFKALTDLYCVADGQFAGGNPALEQ